MELIIYHIVFIFFIEEYFYYGNHKYLGTMVENNNDYQIRLIIDYIVDRYASDINTLHVMVNE